MNGIGDITISLPSDLYTRLNLIIQNIPKFWEQAPYRHFTNHGPTHSERVLNQKLAQLAQELPSDRRLINEELFIASAAAWLYEVGMQSPRLKPVLDFEHEPGVTLSFAQLQQIRTQKHLLTERLIHDSLTDLEGVLELGLIQHGDDFAHLIAMVCRGCSDEPLEQVPEVLPVRGVPVRVRLLVALLRLADQLYIDRSRINLELIQHVDLPVEQLTKWWIYHYTQTLPIVNHQIPFHYFLPVTQREYLGHIRTLVEEQFDRSKNPVIGFLWKQGLHLVPSDTPTFQFDQPARFLREMQPDILIYLRENVKPKEIYVDEAAKAISPSGDQGLLVLDYENFILQLGHEGYFFSKQAISRTVITLLSEAATQSSGIVRGLAIGHWRRADLVEIGELLKARLYDLLTIEEDENPSAILKQELLHNSDASSHILLVTPREDFAPTAARDLRDQKRSVTAWITHAADAEIFRVAVRNHKYVSNVIQMATAVKLDRDRLENCQVACILRLDACGNHQTEGISLDNLNRLLDQIEAINSQLDWWRLWLIDQKILVVDNQRALFKLNDAHTAVVGVRALRAETIKLLLTQSKVDEGLRQDQVITKLRQIAPLLTDLQAVNLLECLKEEEIVRRDARPRLAEHQPLWLLNPSHPCVITLNTHVYLRQFTLALDHALLREGRSHLAEHLLVRHLAPYLDNIPVDLVYKLALQHEWLRRRESDEQRRDGGGRVVHVNLPDRHSGVGETLRNRDILLDLLHHRSARQGIPKKLLWQKLCSIRSFTLLEPDFEWLLKLLEKDIVIEVDRSSQVPGEVLIRLNVETFLTKRLLGRKHIWSLLRNLRLMGSTAPDRKRACSELLERLSKFVVNHDQQQAHWILDYAYVMKLVTVEGDQLYLNSHSFVRQLDHRERATCEAVFQLVKSTARPGHDGWVPRHVVLQKMDEDIQFGYARDEHDYWLDQAIYRLKLLEKRREDDRDRQEFVRIIKRA